MARVGGVGIRLLKTVMFQPAHTRIGGTLYANKDWSPDVSGISRMEGHFPTTALFSKTILPLTQSLAR